MIGELDFGFSIDPDTFLTKMLKLVKKSNSVDGQLIMTAFYEHEYGIFPHLQKNPNRPLATVALHPSEEIIDDSLLEEAIRSYTKRGIKELYNLSVTEFLDLPVHVVNLLIKIADETSSQKHQVAASIERELNQTR